MTYILGISSFYHDSAASLIKDGEIIACAQEERFTRKKHDSTFPKNSIEFCLKFAKIDLSEVDYVVFYEKPFLKFERLLETYISFFPWGLKSFILSFPVWIKEKLFQKKIIIDELKKIDREFDKYKLKFSEHHLSHAASAFFPSSFNKAIILTLDGVGEWTTSSVSVAIDNKINIKKEIHFPHSLGLLYSAFTYYLGFKVNSGEYKVMGLAPYGKPIYYKKIIENLVDIKEDGSFFLDQSFFDYATGLKMISKKFENLFKRKFRNPDENLDQFHMDIAASIQKVTEKIVIKICKNVYKEYKIDNLCLAGGVALNCVANGKILKNTPFKNIWVQPASGDAGGSLGAALALWYISLQNKRKVNQRDSMNGSYLGPEYNQDEIEKMLENAGANFKILDENELIEQTVNDLSNKMAIGWFQGRMEFGPRALGSRSILGDPRSPEMQKNLNLKVKYRESFRPFAPSVLKEHASEWFDLNTDSPYMLMVAEINSNKKIKMSKNEEKLFGIDKLNIIRSEIPAVTHVDYTSRIQTVEKEINQKYYKLLKAFYNKTGCPILVNTSFNVRGEPIVNSPLDAFNCFMGTELDRLIIGNCYLNKNEQNKSQKKNYTKKFELD